ncbi:MAG: hypothetical protein R3F60_16340 [bacterium]
MINLRPGGPSSLTSGARWNEIGARYREVRFILFGDVIKVTSTSKAGRLRHVPGAERSGCGGRHRRRRPAGLPVGGGLSGHLGQPHRGFPPRLQAAILKGRPVLTDRAGLHLADHDFDAAQARPTTWPGRPAAEHDAAPRMPSTLKVFAEYLEHTDEVGNTSPAHGRAALRP